LLEQEGIIFKTGVNIGKDVTGNELLEQFDAVVLTVGASQPRDIKVPGRDANGIHFAVDFLRETTNSLLKSSSRDSLTISAKYKDVVVIGGGDTGNDCVGTSIRHGCRSVVQLEMMPKPPLTRQPNNSWPQWAKVLKTDYGQEEAIAVFGHDPRVFETTVKEFIKDEKNNLIGIKTVMVEFSPDKDGKMVLKEKEGSEKEIPAQLALIAAGFVGTESYVTETFGLSQDNRGNIPTNNFQTQNEKIFAAGDARRGQSLVVWAIREGRDVARAVDNYLMGYSNL
jgi:glutamate synthase (NADPH/NADH) small chain